MRISYYIKIYVARRAIDLSLYYEGWVSDIDKVLQIHSQETLTCYGTRRSCKTSVCENKENKVKMYTETRIGLDTTFLVSTFLQYFDILNNGSGKGYRKNIKTVLTFQHTDILALQSHHNHLLKCNL